MKRIVLLFSLLIVSLIAIAQGETVQPEAASKVLDLFSEIWPLVAPFILWVIYRLVPTKSADVIWKVLTWLIDTFIPDRKSGGGTH